MNIGYVMSLSVIVLMFLVGGGCVQNGEERALETQDSQNTAEVISNETRNEPADSANMQEKNGYAQAGTSSATGDTEAQLFASFGWERVADPYLQVSIGYPVNIYDVELASSLTDSIVSNTSLKHPWMKFTRKNSDGLMRIEIWKLSDMPERPFGITEPGVDPQIVLPKYEEKVIGGETYGIYMFLNGNTDRYEEMKAI